jgi:hypothetical protein
MLMVIDIVIEVGKSLKTPTDVILYLLFWHCTSLRQVIMGLDFCLWVFH